jgi:hypothetical protein
MLRAAKRAIFYAFRVFGYSIVKNSRGGYSLVPNAIFDRKHKQDVLRWATEKIADTEAWAAREEARILEKWRDAEEWIASETAKIEAKRREAEAWVGTEESRIIQQRYEADAWVGTEESRIIQQRREAEAWVGTEESRIIQQRREAEAWVGTEESRIIQQRREAEAWVGTEESRIAKQRREAEAWVGTEESRIAEQRREAEAWVGTEESRIAKQRREAEAWVGEGKAGAERLGLAAGRLETATSDGSPPREPASAARLREFQAIIDSLRPWSGRVPEGYFVDALGVRTRASFRPTLTEQDSSERDLHTQLPSVAGDGEGWFEMVDWLVSAREATDEYVAVSLGAAYGTQLVGAWKALQLVNPLPSLLIAVEAVPENCRWIAQHMDDNGIAPESQVIIQAAVGPDNEVVLFPVGAPGSGRNNCVSTNAPQSRAIYASVLGRPEHASRIVRNLFKANSTGLARDLGDGAVGEVKFVSALTLGDIIGPLRRVDFLEVDIQQSEAEVIPPFIGLLTRKVRRAHIGTHGAAIHAQLRGLFMRAGWEIVFDFAPDSSHDTELGSFPTSDGILTVRNPAV